MASPDEELLQQLDTPRRQQRLSWARLATQLGVAEPTLHTWRRRGQLPPAQRPGVIAWLESAPHTPIPETPVKHPTCLWPDCHRPSDNSRGYCSRDAGRLRRRLGDGYSAATDDELAAVAASWSSGQGKPRQSKPRQGKPREGTRSRGRSTGRAPQTPAAAGVALSAELFQVLQTILEATDGDLVGAALRLRLELERHRAVTP